VPCLNSVEFLVRGAVPAWKCIHADHKSCVPIVSGAALSSRHSGLLLPGKGTKRVKGIVTSV
jgi:hypothetical protein